MKPYPAYKKVGVDWLGEVPAHWDAKRLKFAARVNPSRSEIRNLSADLEVSFYPMEAVGFGELYEGQVRLLGDVSSGFTYFRNDDLLIAKITPSFENGKGALATGLCNGIGFGTTELHVIRPTSELNKEFLFYLTYSHEFRHPGEGMMDGTAGQKRIPNDFLFDYRVAIPPLPEQTAIAAYLDRKTAQIDAVIDKKERLIELLREERTAVISHAVTKGLNPDAPMKDSGVVWLGEVPAHWGAKKLKYVAGLKSGDGISAILISDNGDYPVFGGNGLRGYCSSYTHDGAYVLIGRQGALCGNINYAKGKFWASEHAVVATLNPDIELMWFGELLRGMNLNHFSQSAAQPGLAVEYIKNLEIPIPPFDEQTAIANYVDQRTAEIDQTVTRTEVQIERLREYRTALISAVVTGKVDVREEVEE